MYGYIVPSVCAIWGLVRSGCFSLSLGPFDLQKSRYADTGGLGTSPLYCVHVCIKFLQWNYVNTRYNIDANITIMQHFPSRGL